MKKRSIFLIISLLAFLMTFLGPIVLGVLNIADEVVLWKLFGVFSAVMIVSFAIWAVLALVDKVRSGEQKTESHDKNKLLPIILVIILIFVIIVLNFCEI